MSIAAISLSLLEITVNGFFLNLIFQSPFDSPFVSLWVLLDRRVFIR